MSLRKVLLATGSESNNAASFVNTTADRLHMRKIILAITSSGASTIGESSYLSFDEQPTDQSTTNDSRAHIGRISYNVTGGTGAVIGADSRMILSWNRNDLVLDTDEAFFLNTITVVGPPTVNYTANIFYED